MCKTSATGNPQLKTKRREEAERRAGVDIKAERERVTHAMSSVPVPT